jgi:hypothetical protein
MVQWFAYVLSSFLFKSSDSEYVSDTCLARCIDAPSPKIVRKNKKSCVNSNSIHGDVMETLLHFDGDMIGTSLKNRGTQWRHSNTFIDNTVSLGSA